jgi:hypothetical protein
VSLIRKTITENKNGFKFTEGCNNFIEGSATKEFCKDSEIKIQKNKKSDIKQKIEYVKLLLRREEFNDLVHNIRPYNEKDDFFSYRLFQWNEMKSYLTGCTNFDNSVEKFEKEIKESFIFVKNKENEWEYSILNKLDTNYSAAAFLLTAFREKNKLEKLSFNSIYEKYFNREGINESYFTNFLINYFSNKEDDINIMKKVLSTIEETSKKGAEREREAYEYLVSLFGEGNVKDYTGDYSFVDKFGIDFMVNTIKGWVPVQVKSSKKYLYGNKNLCNNVAMGKENGKWDFKLYEGVKEVETF